LRSTGLRDRRRSRFRGVTRHAANVLRRAHDVFAYVAASS